MNTNKKTMHDTAKRTLSLTQVQNPLPASINSNRLNYELQGYNKKLHKTPVNGIVIPGMSEQDNKNSV